MAANSAGMCWSFKSEILQAIHNLGVSVTRAGTVADTIKAALYVTNSSIGPATTAYTATGEVSGTNYSAGGLVVTNATPPTTSGGSSAFWTPSANISWTTVTLATLFDTVLIYNSSQANRAICSVNFGATTVSAGNFALLIPSNTATTALIQLN